MAKLPPTAIVLGSVLLACAATTAAQSNEQGEPERGGIYWRNRPSIQIGEHIRLDLRLKLQFDWRDFDPEIGEDTYDFRARRWGLNGEIADHVEFQIERDFNANGRWRDVFVNWRTFRQAEVTAGRFKVPFGREQLVGITDVDFAFRTLVSTTIPPARDKGVMGHGRFFRRGLTYQVGVFDGDGDNGRLEEAQFQRVNEPPQGLGHSFAARVTGTPLRALGDAFDTLRIGGAYGTVHVPEGLNSLRGTTEWGTKDFFEPVYVKGRRHRYGAEFVYTPGPVGLVAEWMQAREQRLGQGLGDIDLSDVITTGWYASATWLVTGEDKENFDHPRRPIFTEGIGAIELGARYEELGFESAEKIGEAFSNPRAENILQNSAAIWTLGINWFPSRWTRVVLNAMHESLEDPGRVLQTGITGYWSGVFRLQIVF
jgi:phosphate-selective porin OprO and OprP